MSPQYRYTSKDAQKFNKHGIDLTVFPTDIPAANVVHVSVEEGHFQEFYDKKSYYIYYIYEGSGLFVLNVERIEAHATDLIVIPPKTRIHYFGHMKMVLTVTPRFKEENEQHVRFVTKEENSYNPAK